MVLKSYKKSYKSLLLQQMEEIDYNQFTNLQNKINQDITDDDLKIVYNLHSKYLQHTYNEPCDCKGTVKINIINKWIDELKTIHSNGVQLSLKFN